MQSEWLSEAYARKYPREIAGLKLSRLGIAKEHQRKGFGQALLAEAMKKVLEVFDAAGGIGLFVDAKDEHAKRFYEKHGWKRVGTTESRLSTASGTFVLSVWRYEKRLL